MHIRQLSAGSLPKPSDAVRLLSNGQTVAQGRLLINFHSSEFPLRHQRQAVRRERPTLIHKSSEPRCRTATKSRSQSALWVIHDSSHPVADPGGFGTSCCGLSAPHWLVGDRTRTGLRAQFWDIDGCAPRVMDCLAEVAPLRRLGLTMPQSTLAAADEVIG
jgi:hypothetical protein